MASQSQRMSPFRPFECCAQDRRLTWARLQVIRPLAGMTASGLRGRASLRPCVGPLLRGFARRAASLDALRQPLRRRVRRAFGTRSSRERQGIYTVFRCVLILRCILAHSAWGKRHFSSRPRPPASTLPTTACPPLSTVTRSTRTVCCPFER